MSRPTPNSSTSTARPETVGGLVVSLLFWLALIVATTLFALVALSPKLAEQVRLRGEFMAAQSQLVAIESENERLQRVVDAIRNDPEFATEMTRIEFDAVREGEEVIPVDATLKMESQSAEASVPNAPAESSPLLPYLTLLSQNERLRNTLLSGAAILVIVSFTWLQPISATPTTDKTAPQPRSVWQLLRSRYAVQPESAQTNTTLHSRGGPA